MKAVLIGKFISLSAYIKKVEKSHISDLMIYLKTLEQPNIKPTANIKLNEEKLKVIPLKSGTRQDCPISPHLFKIAL